MFDLSTLFEKLAGKFNGQAWVNKMGRLLLTHAMNLRIDSLSCIFLLFNLSLSSSVNVL